MMRRLGSSFSTVLLTLVVLAHSVSTMRGADLYQIGPDSRHPLEGKETDWIDGDYVIRNESIIAVIARPVPQRDATMMIRDIGGCVIDLTRVDIQSDQLSCFYPTGGRFLFTDESSVEQGRTEEGAVFWRCRSAVAVDNGDARATIEYRLADGDSFLTAAVTIESAGDFQPADGVRADRSFTFHTLAGTGVGYCEDLHFRQTYGLVPVGQQGDSSWVEQPGQYARMQRLDYQVPASDAWTTRIYPASSPADLVGLLNNAAPQTLVVAGAVGDQPRIKVSILDGDVGTLDLPADWYSSDTGKSIVHLQPGSYRIRAEAIGHTPVERTINVTDEPQTHSFELTSASSVVARITDEGGGPIPCKVTFYGNSPTPDPDFGIDSQSGSVGNCVYTADGDFIRSIPPGSYTVLISRGPEYDVADQIIDVGESSAVQIAATLTRVVDTAGWVSAELHSHSTPSGDNTSEQIGRVENLVCEHLEFAPCTEHQRIESYETELEKLGVRHLMATCSGMELTNRDGDLNHQNAFPLKWVPFTQGGGAPRTDINPINQIQRLAMWDQDAEKVIQVNHPDLRKMAFDRDLDGTDDGGFSKMFDYADVTEIHPIQDIFSSPGGKSRMAPWMQMLKAGFRVPGVVNTDAHYNFHGSGALRNWVRCSTDDPAQIKTDEMIERIEGGQIVMSTGPYMTVQLHHADLSEPAEIGDEVSLNGDSVELHVRVQCANWLDVNRVEVFVNGQMQPDLSRTRRSHPDSFARGVVKFDQRLPVKLVDKQSFIIVAAIGERLNLGRVMGPDQGKKPPVVVTNPIFVNRS